MMKLLLLLGFTSLVVARAAVFRHLQYAMTNVQWALRRRPNIPQFILDTQHPWLSDPHCKALLSSSGNVTNALCNLSSPLRPESSEYRPWNVSGTAQSYCRTNSKQTEDYADRKTYPASLFSTLFIDNNRAGVDRPGWKNARVRLQEILACPAALRDVQNFVVTIYISDGSYGIGQAEPPTPPEDLPGLFVEVLSQMPNLTRFEWNTFGHGLDEFSAAFKAANLTLPTVRHLKPAIFCDWLIDMCPNVERLESGESHSTGNYWRRTSHNEDGRMAFVESTKKLAKLRAFHMKGEWELKHLKMLLKCSPNLTELSIGGDLDMSLHYLSREMSLSYDTQNQTELAIWVDLISQFRKLESLSLPDSSELGLGYEGGAWCGNAYMGRGGRAYGRTVSQGDAMACEKAGEIVLSRIPKLKALSIRHKAKITKHDNGSVSATWAWTGRMKEWLYEVWPETGSRDENGDGEDGEWGEWEAEDEDVHFFDAEYVGQDLSE